MTFKLAAVSLITLLLGGIAGCGSSTSETSSPAPSVTASTPIKAEASASPAANAAQKINVNTAPIPELDKLELPGTKPSLSERIEGKRPYQTVDDLVTKKAISQDELTLIKNLITLGENK
jgi:DNA uptake protein ComE-like DNA-binding protein